MTTASNCLTCGGAVFPPGSVVGYSGPICHCIVPPKYQRLSTDKPAEPRSIHDDFTEIEDGIFVPAKPAVPDGTFPQSGGGYAGPDKPAPAQRECELIWSGDYWWTRDRDFIEQTDPKRIGDQFHVIEKSAYLEIQAKFEKYIDKALEKESQLREQVELAKYKDPGSFEEYWCSGFGPLAARKFWSKKTDEAKHLHTWLTAWSKGNKEIERLEKENAELKEKQKLNLEIKLEFAKQLTAAREELESLKDQLQWSIKNEAQYKDVLDQAQARCKRLEEALQKISGGCGYANGVRIAREALQCKE